MLRIEEHLIFGGRPRSVAPAEFDVYAHSAGRSKLIPESPPSATEPSRLLGTYRKRGGLGMRMNLAPAVARAAREFPAIPERIIQFACKFEPEPVVAFPNVGSHMLELPAWQSSGSRRG